MKTLGILGGLSWESTSIYYEEINRRINEYTQGSDSAEILLYSINFGKIERLMDRGQWQVIDEIMVQGAKKLEYIGAEFLIIASNTSHKSFNAVQSAVNIPLLHIGEATAAALKKSNFNKVGLTGTISTMKENHIKNIFENHGIKSVLPCEDDINRIQVIINNIDTENCSPSIKKEFIDICDNLADRGAEAVVLGCTELGILIKEGDCRLPIFDTALIHAEAAACFALN